MPPGQLLCLFCICSFWVAAHSSTDAHGSGTADPHDNTHNVDMGGITQRGRSTDTVLSVFFVLALGAVLRWINTHFRILPYTALTFVVAFVMGIWFRKGVHSTWTKQ